MPKSSIASLIKRCLGAQSLTVKRSILVGSLMTSTFEASFLASAHYLVTQVLQGGSYLHLNVITKIQNISKDIHSKPTQWVQMLLGYIPMTQLKHIKNKAGRCCTLANLFHTCMHKILSGIKHYDETGIAMTTGDGVWYCCHPIIAMFVSDYPEQSLVACTPYGRCPKCSVPQDKCTNY